MIGLISWVVMGVLAGWVVGQAMGGSRKNLFSDIVMGIAGALLGGFLFSFLIGIADAVGSFNVITVIVAFFGASVAVGGVRTMIARRQAVRVK